MPPPHPPVPDYLDLAAVGRRLRDLRGGRTQYEVAAEVGEHQSRISRAEAGDSRQLAVIEKLVEHYGLPPLRGPFYRLD